MEVVIMEPHTCPARATGKFWTGGWGLGTSKKFSGFLMISGHFWVTETWKHI